MEELLPENELSSLEEEVRPVRRSTEGCGEDFLDDGLEEEEEPVSSDIRLEPLVLAEEEGVGFWG